MRRRGFWLLAGAVLGIAGYRRASRAARTLTGQGSVGRALTRQAVSGQALTGPAHRRQPIRTVGAMRAAVSTLAGTAGFVRDVRDGTTEYLVLHRADEDRTLGSRSEQTVAGQGRPGPLGR